MGVSKFISLLSVVTLTLLAAPALVAAGPTVKIDNAIVVGKSNGTVAQYLGLPFAQPPIGDLRLRLPKPIESYHGTIDATTFGTQCIPQTSGNLSLPSSVPAAVLEYLASFSQVPDVPEGEDCLNLNVIAPADATPESKLPVAVWIFGGGFQAGSNAVQPGEVIVARSIELGRPIIFVAMNYRLSAFGFLGGKEVKEAGVGNLGLHDQREALGWIQKYISPFGGDPEKVTIWGESAGAISIALHMLHNGGNTEGLFRAGFMESGAALPTGYVDDAYLQDTFDGIVRDTGCAQSIDAIQCLRTVPASDLAAAMDKTPSFVSVQQANTPWLPRADGVFLAQPPAQQLLSGAVAQIPIVSGNEEDEGSAFSFPTLNITADEEFLTYLGMYCYRNTSRQNLEGILELYSADPSQGSPFGTGDMFAYSPQYKRMSAFEGDYAMQGPRRLFVQNLADRQPIFSFLSEINKVEGIGAAHGTELASVFGGGALGDYLIRFVDTLDPNGDGAFPWPRYTTASPNLLVLADGEPSFKITPDTFRAEQIAYLIKLSLVDPM